MSQIKIEQHAYQHEGAIYASVLWKKLVKILDPDQAKQFAMQFKEHIPLEEMNKYAQSKFLRKTNQRWDLENYHNFNPTIQKKLETLLKDNGFLDTEPMPDKSHLVLFLGTSSTNLFKRVFHLYEEIVQKKRVVKKVIVFGHSEPFDKYLKDMSDIISLHPAMFKEDFGCKQVPVKATMHEMMMLLLENLAWPKGTKPIFLEIPLQHPCYTTDEILAATTYLNAHKPQIHPSFFSPEPVNKKLVTILAHQPFNNRQGIIALAGFSRACLLDTYDLCTTGASTESWPLLQQFPAAGMSPAQIVDNLTRTLYEINQNKDVLFAAPSVELELVCR